MGKVCECHQEVTGRLQVQLVSKRVLGCIVDHGKPSKGQTSAQLQLELEVLGYSVASVWVDNGRIGQHEITSQTMASASGHTFGKMQVTFKLS